MTQQTNRFFTNFGESRSQYQKFRPKYPSKLFEIIFSNVSQCDLAIDVGAGTGLSIDALAKKFEMVIGVEPDKNMTDKIEFSNNVLIENQSAEEFNFQKFSPDLITFGNVFYWLDGEQILSKIDTSLNKNSILAVYRYKLPQCNEPVQQIIDMEYNTNWQPYVHPRLLDQNYTERILRNSGIFSDIQKITVPNIIELRISELIGFFTSTSYVSAYLESLQTSDEYLDTLFQKLSMAQESKKMLDVDFSLELFICKK